MYLKLVIIQFYVYLHNSDVYFFKSRLPFENVAHLSVSNLCSIIKNLLLNEFQVSKTENILQVLFKNELKTINKYAKSNYVLNRNYVES